jgi:hypothetical protein
MTCGLVLAGGFLVAALSGCSTESETMQLRAIPVEDDCDAGDCDAGYCDDDDCDADYCDDGDCDADYCDDGDCDADYCDDGDCDAGDCDACDCDGGYCDDDCDGGYCDDDCDGGYCDDDCDGGYCDDDCDGGYCDDDCDGGYCDDDCDDCACDDCDCDGYCDAPLDITQCETAFARATSDATCFLGADFDGDGVSDGFKRWGWSNGPLAAWTSSEWPVYASAGQCDVSKGTLVGHLRVRYDGSTAEIKFNRVGKFVLDEEHIYVGNDPLPTNKQGKYTVAPGLYPIGVELHGAASSSHVIGGLSGKIFVVYHAVACP